MKPALIAVAIAVIGLGCTTAPAKASYLSVAAGGAWPSTAVQAQRAIQAPTDRRSYGPPQRSDIRRQARPRRRDPEPRPVAPPQQGRAVETPRWEPGSGY